MGVRSQIIFQEDFNNIPGPTAGGAGTYVFPSGWFLRNVDNRTPNSSVAYVNEAWERREDFIFNVADSCAFSTSWYNPVGSADDWMWTPLIVLQDNCIVSWRALAPDPTYPDGYEVRIMVSPNMPTGGTGNLGNQISASTLLLSIPAENSSWTNRSINLAAYENQSVYIGFRNNSVDKFLLLIDDVTVTRLVNFDAAITATDKAEFTQIPASQERELSFTATVMNKGISDLTNVVLHTTVYDQTESVVFTASSTPLGLLGAGLSTNLSSTTAFVANAAGNFRILYAVTADQTDVVPANDTTSRYVTVSDNTFARDDGIFTSTLGIGAGNGYLGNEYPITRATQLASVSIYSNSHIGDMQMGCAVFLKSGGAPSGPAVFNATPSTIPGGAPGMWYDFSVTPALNLNPGDTIVVVAVGIDSTLLIGTTPVIYTQKRMWIDWASNPFGGWTNVEQYGSAFERAFGIRANLGAATCTDGIKNGDETGIDCGGSCGPCPPPDAVCGVITVYVNINNPVYDGPGTNNIWWIPAEDLDAGSISAYIMPSLEVRRYLSTLTFDWTTLGACIDATPNGGSLSLADKGSVYRGCLPVRNADFNVWKMYQLQIQDPAGTDACVGTIKVIPQTSPLLSTPTVHFVIPAFTEEDFQVSIRAGAGQENTFSGLVAYPNPGTDLLTLEWLADENQHVQVSIYRVDGQKVITQELDSGYGKNIVTFDMSDQIPGLYFIEMHSPKLKQTIKWSKAF